MGIIGYLSRKQEEIAEGKSPAQLDLECEMKIQEVKQEHGRVSTMVMRVLREQYGRDRADRAMYRQQKQKVEKNVNKELVQVGVGILSSFLNREKNDSV